MEVGRWLLRGRAPGVEAKTWARARATDGFSATLSTIMPDGYKRLIWPAFESRGRSLV